MNKIRTAALRHFETTLIILILFGVLATAFLVHLKFSFLNFFFLPVILAGYYLGKRQAVLTASLCILLVVLYLVFAYVIFQKTPPLRLDEILNVVVWAGFLILTAGIIGGIAEQREARLKSLQRAYIGVLEIMLKYFEVADEKRPRSLRISLLAGKIATALGFPTFQVENIKSAALLVEAGDLRANISLYEKVAAFMAKEGGPMEKQVEDRGRVLLQTTALLLKEVEPILANYFYHYVEEAAVVDKDLSTIPLGSSIIALADLYDRISIGLPAPQWKDQIKSAQDIKKLSGRAFPAAAVHALFQVAPPIHQAG
jgi:hypothetical protein